MSPSALLGGGRLLAGGAIMTPTSPGLSAVSAGDSSLALSRGQFAQEFGGVLLDPTTNEVCLLFYPDTSEWRLPMGRPDAPEELTVGCEPQAHAAQRQISAVTGYRCTHIHPTVGAHSDTPCAYIGPQMVEPLALQIEQRATHCTRPSTDTTQAADGAEADPHDDPDGYHQRPQTSHFVLTHYYMAWLTQNRFESKAATLPVGPAAAMLVIELTDSTLNRQPARALPLAEVTWFKMDTAAQVLTHAADKLALREAIHRLVRLPEPALPFAYSAVLRPAPPSPRASEVSDDKPLALAGASDNSQRAPSGPAEPLQPLQLPSSAASNVSDSATRTDMGSHALVPATRNFAMIRKAATSLGKHRGLFSARQRPAAAASESPAAGASSDQLLPAADAADEPARRAAVPRVFSMFYRLVGSSAQQPHF
ncbi:hypothetical protein IWQ56_001481 [Coemansia nantahalensis]|nr:hypothetical protein IWQ56_001481 [Coemansia nantahalensis]